MSRRSGSLVRLILSEMAREARRQERLNAKRQRESARLQSRQNRLNATYAARRSAAQAKLDAKRLEEEEARAEVADFERDLDSLLSAHKAKIECVNWKEEASTLPTWPPATLNCHEKAAMRLLVCRLPNEKDDPNTVLAKARELDQQDSQSSADGYAVDKADWSRSRTLALRIIDQDLEAYAEFIKEADPFSELSEYGCATALSNTSTRGVECAMV